MAKRQRKRSPSPHLLRPCAFGEPGTQAWCRRCAAGRGAPDFQLLKRTNHVVRRLMRIAHGGLDAAVAEELGDYLNALPIRHGNGREGLPQPVGRSVTQALGRLGITMRIKETRGIFDVWP